MTSINNFSITIIAIIVAIICVAVLYNRLIVLKNYIKEAFSTMDVYLKKRWDLIPNLIETTKAYCEHEKSLLENITSLRNKNYSNLTGEEKIDINNELGLGLSKLIAVAENYPDLKANQNFLNLQNELSKIEDDIANSRKYYNGCVREFNTAIELFPVNILASMFGFKAQKMFEIDNEQRENIKVTF